jgi:hypothetical protein
MTRQQQNEYIIGALETQLSDMPNVQERIGDAFTVWFQALVQKGMQVLAPPPPVESTEQPAAGAAEEQSNGVD